MTTLTAINPVNAAAALCPALRARAAEGEAIGRLPADLVDAAADTGLFRLGLPRSLGGLEVDPLTILSVIEELGCADGSAGWTILIGNSTAFLAWLEPAVARQLLDGPPGAAAAVFAPNGRAVPDGANGYTLNGQWPFASGCPHARIVQAGMFVYDGDTPRLRPDGRPDWRFAYLPSTEVEVIETWDALGLRGTASHDVRISGVQVPEERTAMPFLDAPRHDGPLWRFPFVGLLTIMTGGLPLGIARRAIEEVVALAPTKRRANQPGTVAEDGRFQVELARAEASVLAARSLLIDATGAAWDTACNGNPVTNAETGRMQLASLLAMEASTAAVDLAFHFAGAGSVYTSNPIQRCFRDIHTAGQHLAFNPAGYQGWAKSRLGITTPA